MVKKYKDDLLADIELKAEVSRATAEPEAIALPSNDADPFIQLEQREKRELRAKNRSVFSDL